MTPALATIIKLKTADGLVEMAKNIQIGTTYRVDLETMREVPLCNIEFGKNHSKMIITRLTGRGEPDGWLAVELLRIES